MSLCERKRKREEEEEEEERESAPSCFQEKPHLIQTQKITTTAIVVGDIVLLEADLLVQQCNCLTTQTRGLSDYLSKTLGVNIYSDRKFHLPRKNLSVVEDRGVPGTCVIVPNLNRSVQYPSKYVACLLAQFAPGKPKKFYQDVVAEYSFKDNAEDRLEWFSQSLKNLKVQLSQEDYRAVKRIAFPKLIGCGLAGGKPALYKKVIDEFVASLEGSNVVEVYLCEQ